MATTSPPPATKSVITILDADGREIFSGIPPSINTCLHQPGVVLNGWVERNLNIDPLGYRLRQIKKNVHVLELVSDLAAVFRQQSANGVCLGCVALRSLENRAVMPGNDDMAGLWLQFGKALAALAPRFTKTMSLMRMFDGELLGFNNDVDDDDDFAPEARLLGTLEFCSPSPEITTITRRQPRIQFSVVVGAQDVRVGGSIFVNIATDAATPPITVPFVAIWNRGADSWYAYRDLTVPLDNEMTVVSSDSAEDADALRSLLLGPPHRGRLVFQAHEYPHARVDQVAELRFVRASDLYFWADTPEAFHPVVHRQTMTTCLDKR